MKMYRILIVMYDQVECIKLEFILGRVNVKIGRYRMLLIKIGV